VTRRTRPGQDRLRYQRLTAQVSALEQWQRRHIKGCRICQRAQDDLYARCGPWWSSAKALYGTRRMLSEYAKPQAEGMDTLPGMEYTQ
jgi:hypothetical protein